MNQSNYRILLAIIFVIAVLYNHVDQSTCELYTSTDEIANLSQAIREVATIINQKIEEEELKLLRLKEVYSLLNYAIDERKIDHNSAQEEDSVDSGPSFMNPVNVFVLLHRLNLAINYVSQLYLNTNDKPEVGINRLFSRIDQQLPTEDDLIGAGQALLRLQVFYNLSIFDLINGHLGKYSTKLTTLRMDGRDCFELGKIAFRDDQFNLAIQWLFKALEMTFTDKMDVKSNQMINELLDYMAYAAYKLGLVEYSANLTRTWLEREPDNERARENLLYYLDKLENDNEEVDDDDFRQSTDQENLKTFDGTQYERLESIDRYSVTEDEAVVRLCKKSGHDIQHIGKCIVTIPQLTQDNIFYPGIKIEILNEDPKIMRIYDVITVKEAEHFKQLAKPLLERSTVNSGSGLKTSNFRIAKTAWLMSDNDLVVKRVETRLGSILDLRMENSEHFQVVNYGLGGFYGPHLDSARATKTTQTSNQDSDEEEEEAVLVSELQRNDRLATVLIYLDRVEAGGSTVFPRLNLTVVPIERSAIVWFNLQETGNSDERTLHTGCPVLLGSKWIATKWPREQSNTFKRPCRL